VKAPLATQFSLRQTTELVTGKSTISSLVLTQNRDLLESSIENAEDNTANTISSTKGGARLRVRQLAGEGSACDSVLTQTDNGVGHGVENAEDNTANTISSTTGSGSGSSGGSNPPPPPPPNRLRRRQLAGEGSACDSVLTQTDNGVGHGVENAEDNTANTISSTKGGARKRQADKIAHGAQQVGNSVGAGAVTGPVGDQIANADGTLTSGAANAGAQVGNTEDSTLENAGSQVPRKVRRQADKIAHGAQQIGNAVGAQAVTGPVGDQIADADGTLTSGAANAGAQVGNTEDSTLENAGSQVPRKFKRQADKIAHGAQQIGNAVGAQAVTGPVGDQIADADGTLTSGAANAGAQVGNTEDSTLENAGNQVPRL
jgi:hypothetical protein